MNVSGSETTGRLSGSDLRSLPTTDDPTKIGDLRHNNDHCNNDDDGSVESAMQILRRAVIANHFECAKIFSKKTDRIAQLTNVSPKDTDLINFNDKIFELATRYSNLPMIILLHSMGFTMTNFAIVCIAGSLGSEALRMLIAAGVVVGEDASEYAASTNDHFAFGSLIAADCPISSNVGSIAIRRGHIDFCKMLIKRKIDIGPDAMYQAAVQDDHRLVCFLIVNKITVIPSVMSAIVAVASDSIICMLIAAGYISDDDGIVNAVKRHNFRTAKLMVECGWPIDLIKIRAASDSVEFIAFCEEDRRSLSNH